jgi:VanZ family protein
VTVRGPKPPSWTASPAAAPRVFRTAFAVLFAVVVAAASWPELRLPPPPAGPARIDLLLHGGGFLALGVLARLGWPHRRPHLFVLLVPVALLLEAVQLAVPGRTVSWADTAANLAGLTAALLVPAVVRRRRARPPAAAAGERALRLGPARRRAGP